MVPEIRQAFNAGFTDQAYRDLQRALDAVAGGPI
jgi:hypothetical protein